MSQNLTAPDTALAIPGYEVLERIGQGGMGTVYRAMQLSLNRPVAIKVLHLAGDGESAPAFQRESHLMASLSHPNIVAIHDSGRVGEHSYLVTELVLGKPLRVAMIPGQPWPVRRVLPVLDAIARALSYIHGKGVLHLDLKPENVLCPLNGEIKITDFGLALSEVDARQLAEKGLAQGTVDYCAPEQRHGLKTDPRSDLFSFAVIAYELLTGRVPGRVSQPPSQVSAKLPKAVDEVFRRALARKAHERYDTVYEFHSELSKALIHRPWTISQVAMLAASVFLAVFVSVKFSRSLGAVAPEPPARVWLINEDPATLAYFQPQGRRPLAEIDPLVPVVSLRGSDLPAGRRIHPEVPSTPLPLPALVISSKGSLGFYHPYQASALAEKVLRQWQELAGQSPIPDEANLLKGGGFDDDCLSHDIKKGIWRVRGGMNKIFDSVAVEMPPDRPGNPALMLSRKASPSSSGKDLGLFQNLPAPEKVGGSALVLRFRARAEEGEPRLSIGPRYHLKIPKGDQSPLAKHLRSVSLPHKFVKATNDSEVRDYWTVNWFTPTQEWQTYVLVWEWPAYEGGRTGRNLEIIFAGLGRAWLDDVELFTWQ